jgi:hypothetical protein
MLFLFEAFTGSDFSVQGYFLRSPCLIDFFLPTWIYRISDNDFDKVKRSPLRKALR